MFFRILLLQFALLAPSASAAPNAPEERLALYRSERLGYEVLYRSGYFRPEPPSESGDGRIFRSEDGAELSVAAIASPGWSMADIERSARTHLTAGIVTYRSSGRNWVVLSGYGHKGNVIYILSALFQAPSWAAEAGREFQATLLYVYPPEARHRIDRDIGPSVQRFLRSIGLRR